MHFDAHSSTVYNSQAMEATQVSINREMDKEDVIHILIYIVEYYSTIKKNEILPFAATWLYLENIMLSVMSDRERQILYDITYMWNLKNNTN